MEKYEERRLLAQDFQHIADLPDLSDSFSGEPLQTVRVGSTVYFSARTPDQGRELWRSDGTEAGTFLVKDIEPGASGSNPFNLTAVNGVLFFTAERSSSGRELWRSDGTEAGTLLVADIRPGSNSSAPRLLRDVGGSLQFLAIDDSGLAIWRSDGSSSGTRRLLTVPGPATSGTISLDALGTSDFYYVTARYCRDTDRGNEICGAKLFVSDGTSGGTLERAESDEIILLGEVNGSVLLSYDTAALGNELWRISGSPHNLSLVADIAAGAFSSAPEQALVVGDELYFTAWNNLYGRELWKSDGTFGGTRLVSNLEPGSDSSEIALIGKNGSTALFSNKQSLWASEGTPATTVELAAGIAPDGIGVEAGQHTYFNSALGNRLWRTNGTAAGTKNVDPHPSQNSREGSLTALGNELLFAANDGSIGRELWKIQDPQEEAILVSDIVPVPDLVESSVQVDSFLYVLLSNGELWATDGTPNGLLEIGRYRISEMVAFRGELYFAADPFSDPGLWKTDGTVAGTTSVATFPGNAIPSRLTVAGDDLFFALSDGTKGFELWASDGTEDGTGLVRDISPGSSGSFPFNMVEKDGELFFSANDGVHGFELWRSDGSGSGTQLVKDIRPGSGTGAPAEMTVFNGDLYFRALDGTTGFELWKSDGTEAGTVRVKDILPGAGSSSPADFTVLNDMLYFQAHSDALGRELWKTDGTEAGTQMVADIHVGLGSSTPAELTVANDLLFFLADDGTRGRELWKSDGTVGGTELVREFLPGSGQVVMDTFTRFNDLLYFRAEDLNGLPRLWRTDGSPSGTYLATDIAGNPVRQVQPHLIPLPDQETMIVAALDSETGEDLFAFLPVDLGDAPTLVSGAEDGARHRAIGPSLGQLRDSSEFDGIASTLADSDDLTGLDDEDGVRIDSELVRNSPFDFDISVRTNEPAAMVSAWADWNADGDWDDANESLLLNESLVGGLHRFEGFLPEEAALGNASFRFRISSEGQLQPTGFSYSGEVEDYVVPVRDRFVVDLPGGQSSSDFFLSVEAGNLRLTRNNNAVLLDVPVEHVHGLRVNTNTGSSQQDDIFVDYTSAFNLPEGLTVIVDGPTDRLIVTGQEFTTTVTADTTYAPVGDKKLVVRDGQTELSIVHDAELVALQDILRFDAVAVLDIGSGSLGIDATLPVDLGPMTLLSGGSINSSSTVALGNGESILGHGSIAGPFSSSVGSIVRATGSLELGNEDSHAGVVLKGELEAGTNMVSLLDAGLASIGSQTKLGDTDNPGTLQADRGLAIDFGTGLTGFGTVQTPLDASKPLINNGSIVGVGGKKITLPGYVKGVGTLENVEITGTYSPGLSPAKVYLGAVQYSSNSSTIIELGGTIPGSGHDQVNHSGLAELAGTLSVELLGGFVPEVGDRFRILTSSAGISGTYDQVQWPQAAAGLAWDIVYGSDFVDVQIVDIPEVASVLIGSEEVAGDNAQQRSRVSRLRIQIDGEVDIDSDAFAVTKRGPDGGAVASGFTSSFDGSNTFVDLSFSGAFTRATGALVDGSYELLIDAARLRRGGSSVRLDGDADGSAGGNYRLGDEEADQFYAYFGDTTGDRVIGVPEFNQFRNTFGKSSGDPLYNALFDFDAGVTQTVGIADFNQFRRRFGKSLPFE